MDETKSIFASKTFWGAIVAALSGMAGIFGVDVSGPEQEAIVSGIAAVGVAVGTVIAIVGRMKADKRVG